MYRREIDSNLSVGSLAHTTKKGWTGLGVVEPQLQQAQIFQEDKSY